MIFLDTCTSVCLTKRSRFCSVQEIQYNFKVYNKKCFFTMFWFILLQQQLNKMAAQTLIASITLMAIISVALADINCQVCSYGKTAGIESGMSDCKDPFTGSHSKNCTGSSYCMKTKSDASVFGIKVLSVDRACGLTCTKVGTVSTDIFGINVDAHCCQGADCNSAGTAVPTLFLICAAVLAYFKLWITSKMYCWLYATDNKVCDNFLELYVVILL